MPLQSYTFLPTGQLAWHYNCAHNPQIYYYDGQAQYYLPSPALLLTDPDTINVEPDNHSWSRGQKVPVSLVSTSPGLYYVDGMGDHYWFSAEVPRAFLLQISVLLEQLREEDRWYAAGEPLPFEVVEIGSLSGYGSESGRLERGLDLG